MAPCRLFSPKRKGPDMPLCSLFTGTYGIRGLCWVSRAERRGLSNPKRLIRKKWLQLQPLWSHLPVLLPAAMETFCETVQFYLRHLEDSLYPVMTEDQFAVKLFPMYRYFVTVWLRHQDLEVRLALLRGPEFPGLHSPGLHSPQGAAGLLGSASFLEHQRPWNSGDAGWSGPQRLALRPGP